MHTKLLISAAAIALAASFGSASADEEFTTLEGITADAITPQEMGQTETGSRMKCYA